MQKEANKAQVTIYLKEEKQLGKYKYLNWTKGQRSTNAGESFQSIKEYFVKLRK